MTDSFWTVSQSADRLTQRLDEPISERSLDALAAAGGIPSGLSSRGGLVFLASDVDRLADRTHLPMTADEGFAFVRVSVLARRPSDPIQYPDGSLRTEVGVRIGAMSGRSARRAWTGVWPVSESVCADAAGAQIPLVGSLRGWIHRSVARRIVAYALVEPGRRAFHTKRLTAEQEQVIFAGNEWAYIPVGQGPIAALERL